MNVDDIKTDPEFEALFADTRLTGADLEHLRTKLVAEGFHDPLVLWRGVLLDGYTRLAICREEGIEPAVRSLDLPDREAAVEWIRLHQHSRRNLDAKARALNIAAVYESRKRRHGGEREASGTGYHLEKTRDEVAVEFNVSPSAVKNAVEYKRGLDAIEAEDGPEAKEEAQKLSMKKVRERGRKAAKAVGDAVEKLVATVRSRLQSWSLDQRKAFIRGVNKVRAELGL